MEMISWITCAGLLLVVAVYLLDKLFLDAKGKYVLITGCDTGFGNLLARSLDKRAGCHVIATCLSESGRAELERMTSPRTTAILLDVQSSESISKAHDQVQRILPKGKGLWGVVNNAGIISPMGLPHWHRRQDIARVFNVNLLGTIDVTNTFTPLVRAAKGRIVNVSSGVALFPTAGSYYAVSKAGVEAFSDYLRSSMRLCGVSVHVIEPGSFKSPFVEPGKTRQLLRALWNQLPVEERLDFGGDVACEALEQLMTEALQMASPRLHLVTEAMEHALFARFPWRRYLPGWEAKLFYKLFSLLPAILTDLFFSLVLNYILKRTMNRISSNASRAK